MNTIDPCSFLKYFFKACLISLLNSDDSDNFVWCLFLCNFCYAYFMLVLCNCHFLYIALAVCTDCWKIHQMRNVIIVIMMIGWCLLYISQMKGTDFRLLVCWTWLFLRQNLPKSEVLVGNSGLLGSPDPADFKIHCALFSDPDMIIKEGTDHKMAAFKSYNLKKGFMGGG